MREPGCHKVDAAPACKTASQGVACVRNVEGRMNDYKLHPFGSVVEG